MLPETLETTPRPTLQRDPEHKTIAGVASGLGAHLGVPASWPRIGFAALAFFNGIGIFLYAALWVLLPLERRQEPPGLQAASRSGMRPANPLQLADKGTLVSVSMISFGVLWVLLNGVGGISDVVFWSLAMASLGVLVVWLQADRAALRSPAPSDKATWWQQLGMGNGAASGVRLLGGLVLVGAGMSWLLATTLGPTEFPMVLLSALALLAGLFVVAAPWIYQARTRLRRAEQEQLRSEARADMAAHLHDSVLQTLALIQRQAEDGSTVRSLARRQERELRNWLYGEQTAARSLKGALQTIRADTEERFSIHVEVVCVGDAELSPETENLVLATREAVTNAAKHSGSERVDVYAEVAEGKIEIYIRDRGAGFDEATISEDRMGVRESIHARMSRHGGSSRVRSAPGEGTEVKLEMSQ